VSELHPELRGQAGRLDQAERSAAKLLQAVESVLCDYVVVGAEERCAVALWVLHTHTFAVEGGELFSASEVTPYLHVMSPAPGCGKSTLFEVLETIVGRAKMVAAGISKASLIRLLHGTCPTLLLDEVDLLMKGDREAANAIHQAINAGYRRRGTAELLAPTPGGGWENTSMRVFSPKAFAGIGRLPHSLATRTIPIGLRPKMPDETVRDKWEDLIWAETTGLRDDLAEWGAHTREQLRSMRELDMPNELHNRTREIWRPLWAIADLAGAEWPDRARRAAVALHTARSQELDHRVLLLADIRDIFEGATAHRMHTKGLLRALLEIEDHPWRGWWMDTYGGEPKKEAAYKLAKILRDYGIEPENSAFLVGTERARGYAKATFETAWKQYLPLPAVSPVSSVQPKTSDQTEYTDNTRNTEGRRLPAFLRRFPSGSPS
jgi:hypothetical protein